jgi:hypothetical protein
MWKIAEKVENHFLVYGINKLDTTELSGLGIRGEVYITINGDGTYYIVNKAKNIVYRSDLNKIVEEDSDY